MKIYLISQSRNNNYDTYDSAVVIEENEETARLTHPGGSLVWYEEGNFWHYPGDRKMYGIGEFGDYSWTSPKFVDVEYIGEAKEGSEPGVYCASFNAG